MKQLFPSQKQLPAVLRIQSALFLTEDNMNTIPARQKSIT